MKAYRVENQQKGHGIWRDFDGTVNPVFKHLTQGKCKDMPMEDSDFYRAEGKKWFSATDTPEKLKAWFSALDVKEMLELGYEIFEFEITNCREVSMRNYPLSLKLCEELRTPTKCTMRKPSKRLQSRYLRRLRNTYNLTRIGLLK